MFSVFFIHLSFVCVHGYPGEKKLHHHLFANYSNRVFPSDIVGQPVNISIKAEMNYIIAVDEKSELLTSDLQLIVTWKDDTLVWDVSQFGGIKDILVPVEQVWIPDLAIQNSLTDRRRLVKDDQLVQIYFDGTVKWVPDYVGPILCPLNVTNYPFDSQSCTTYIESLAHGSDKVDIVALTGPSVSGVFRNGQWKLTSTSSKLTREISGDSAALITLHISRRPMYHLISAVLPAVVTSCLNPFVFLLPSECGEKVALSTTMLLFYSVMLTYIFDNMPPSSLSMPMLGLFVGVQLVLSGLALICTVVMLHFSPVGKTRQTKQKDDRNDETLDLKGQRFFRRLNATLFVMFSLAELTICVTIFILIQT